MRRGHALVFTFSIATVVFCRLVPNSVDNGRLSRKWNSYVVIYEF